MNTVYVWILLLSFHGDYPSYSRAMTVIDNIATAEECQRVGVLYVNNGRGRTSRCIQVKKVFVK